MKEILKMTLKLFVITFIAGALLGGTYFITKDPIAEQETRQATEARQQVLPEAASFEAVDMAAISADEAYSSITEVYTGKDAAGSVVGATVRMTAKGFKPGIVLTVGIKSDGTVSGVSIGSHEETAGLGAKATEPEFYEQFAGKPADGSLSVIKNGTAGESEILAISGATITSKGITDAVNSAVGCYDKYVKG